jgi:peptidyl-prolyl cis-trans isomerase SurA
MKSLFRLWLVGTAATFCMASARADLVNSIQAVVHDTVITRQDVVEMTLPAVKVLQRTYRGQDDVIRKKLAEADRDNLETLARRQLILHEFKTAGYSLPESILDEMVEDRIRSRYGDRRTMAKTLQSEGITVEKFRARLREQFIVEAMRAKNISQEILISPQKIENFYAANREEFKEDYQVKLRMIVLPKNTSPEAPRADKMAEEILLQLKEGAQFDEMSALYSQGAQKASEGQWYETSGLRKELAEGIVGLKAGEYSKVVDLPEACYVLRVEEVKEEHYKPLTDVREEIEKTLATQERDRLEKQWVERLKKKTFVRYYP